MQYLNEGNFPLILVYASWEKSIMTYEYTMSQHNRVDAYWKIIILMTLRGEKKAKEKHSIFHQLSTFFRQQINLHFHFVMIYYSVSSSRLRLRLLWYAKQFWMKKGRRNFPKFFLWWDICKFSSTGKSECKSKGWGEQWKISERLFVKQNCNNMPQVSSIKIYISANNERAGKWKITRLTNDS